MIYIFHRLDGWYPMELPNSTDAQNNAECNPGTLKVTEEPSGRIVWEAEQLGYESFGKRNK